MATFTSKYGIDIQNWGKLKDLGCSVIQDARTGIITVQPVDAVIPQAGHNQSFFVNGVRFDEYDSMYLKMIIENEYYKGDNPLVAQAIQENKENNI